VKREEEERGIMQQGNKATREHSTNEMQVIKCHNILPYGGIPREEFAVRVENRNLANVSTCLRTSR
jgi:hypothetical protein